MAQWHWEPVTDDLLDGLPPAALTAVRPGSRGTDPRAYAKPEFTERVASETHAPLTQVHS